MAMTAMLLLAAGAIQGIALSADSAPSLALRYAEPAKSWMMQALPIGNGRIGGMLFGGVDIERMQFNEISLWTGDEKDTGNYQNFGDLYIDMGGETVTEGGTHLPCSASETVAASADGSPKTKWCVEHQGREAVWLKRFPSPGIALNTYALTSANDMPSRDPRTWFLEGSTNGLAWAVIDKK
jgi:alpha-L-fucosidase 2